MIGNFAGTQAMRITDHFGKLQRREIVLPNAEIERIIQDWLYANKNVPQGAKWSWEWFTRYDEKDSDKIVEEGVIVVLKVEAIDALTVLAFRGECPHGLPRNECEECQGETDG